MAFFATFVGINRYSAPQISELTCAANDARAFHALFSDSIAELQAQCLLDEKATHTAIETALEKTFGESGTEDIALFYFAGHGADFVENNDFYTLIAHDTQCIPGKNSLEKSISMPRLAEYLNLTQAKAAIVILDCCHSGGAISQAILPSRPRPVTNASPSAQQLTDSLQGQGRLIICASRPDEYAWETNGHGLLSNILLDIFQSSKDGIGIGYLTDELNRRMCAETQRLGENQTPCTALNTVGGLKLPVLSAGKTYEQLFPQTSSVKVTNEINNLSGFGFPKNLITVWEERYSNHLLDLQCDAINQYRVLDGESLLTVAPTSSGKTFIGELAAAKALLDGRKAIFLLPFKALTNEKFDEFSRIYGDQLGYRVIRCTGDYSDDSAAIVTGRYDIALLTYEKFLGLLLNIPALLNKIGLVVIDEIQFIADSNRGINLELLLTRLITARSNGIRPQLVALSAVIGNVNAFDDWLGCKLLYSDKRPLPLIEGVLDRSGIYQYLDEQGIEQTEQLLNPTSIQIRRKKESSQDVIVPLIQKLVHEQREQVVVFRNQRGSASGCANYLSNDLGLPPAVKALEQLPMRDTSRTSETLRSSLQGGAAFHTSDLNKEEKAVVETCFRAKNSEIHVLAATTTVAAGVNTPAATVIIAEHNFVGKEKTPYSVAEYKNMAGRAGRLGFTERGRSILLASHPHERQQLFEHYVKGSPEPLDSVFDIRHIDTWVLRLLSQISSLPKDELPSLLANTYGGYLAVRSNPDWQNYIQQNLAELIEKMLSLDLLEEEDGEIKLTLLGQACGQSSLSFASIKRIIRFLRQFSNISSLQLLACLQIIDEMGWISVHKTIDSKWASDVVRIYGQGIAYQFQKNGVGNIQDYHGRCKRSIILHAWISGQAINVIEQHFQINSYQGTVRSGDIVNWANTARLYLPAVSDIASLLLLGQVPAGEDVEKLLQSLEFGLPGSALDLLKLPVALTRGEQLALIEAGYVTCYDVLELTDEELGKYLNQDNVALLTKFRLAQAA